VGTLSSDRVAVPLEHVEVVDEAVPCEVGHVIDVTNLLEVDGRVGDVDVARRLDLVLVGGLDLGVDGLLDLDGLEAPGNRTETLAP